MSWTIFILLWDIYDSRESFPRPSLDVLDYCSYNAILPWDIYRPYEQLPRPPPNASDHLHIMTILLQGMYDSCEQLPRPPCGCPGLLLIKGQTMCLIRFQEDKNIRSPVQSASSSHKLCSPFTVLGTSSFTRVAKLCWPTMYDSFPK
jgi:hypothetical protein